MDAPGIGLATAFAAGVVSFLSPCVLPVVPGYISYVAGQAGQGLDVAIDTRRRMTALMLSAFFVLGFGVVFVVLGASAAAIGRLFLRYRYEANIVGGVIVVMFGLAMLGAFRYVPWFQRDFRLHPRLAGPNKLRLAVVIAIGVTASVPAFAGRDGTQTNQPEKAARGNDRQYTQSATSLDERAMELVLRLDHGSHAQTTPWLNAQRRLRAQANANSDATTGRTSK